MRTAGALMYLSFVVAVFASILPRTAPAWTVLVCIVVALFVAALLRTHAAINPRGGDE